MNHRKQLAVFAILLILYAFCAFITYAFFLDQIAATAGIPLPQMPASNDVLGAGQCRDCAYRLRLAWPGRILVCHQTWAARNSSARMGTGGGGFSSRSCSAWPLAYLSSYWMHSLPRSMDWATWSIRNFPSPFLHPSVWGLGGDHVPADLSLVCGHSFSTGCSRRFHGRTAALWIANGSSPRWLLQPAIWERCVVLTGASSLSELSPVLLAEIFLLNGVIGLVAGERYMKDGLVAAVGVHFWTDMSSMYSMV